MNCKKCDYELSDDVDLCPRCGTSQSQDEENIQGVEMKLFSNEEREAIEAVATGTDSNSIEERIESVSHEAAEPSSKKDIKDAMKKAQTGIKNVADKVAKVSVTAAKNVSSAVETVSEEAQTGGGKKLFYTVIGVSLVIFILIVIGLLTFDSSEDTSSKVLVATSQDEVFLVDGDELVQLTDDVPEDVGVRDILVAKDKNSFYIIKDVELDEDYGEYVGELVLQKSNGKEIDIDEDVIVETMNIQGKILWYLKADKDESIICCYNGRETKEVAQEKGITAWFGTDIAGAAYYSVLENKDDKNIYESFYVTRDDSKSIMEDAFIKAVSNDYKKVLLETTDDDNAIKIFDGKKSFEVMDEVVDICVDLDTFNMLVISDEEDRELYYIPYQKEEIEIDDEVDEIVSMPYLYSWLYTQEGIGNSAFYKMDDNLYRVDLKNYDNERVVKNVSELEIVYHDNDDEFIYVDDEEVVRYNYKTQKEITVELPDAEDLTWTDISIFKNLYAYRTEDNKELFAYRGKNHPIELSNDAEEIQSFRIVLDGKYVMWLTIDDELILSPIKEKSDEEIGDDVYIYCLTDDKEIYFISDFEQGEGGDLYYISRVGKDAIKVDKDIDMLRWVYYDK